MKEIRTTMQILVLIPDQKYHIGSALEFAGFHKSGSTKWQKPETLLHDNSLEISQTKNPLHNKIISQCKHTDVLYT